MTNKQSKMNKIIYLLNKINKLIINKMKYKFKNNNSKYKNKMI